MKINCPKCQEPCQYNERFDCWYCEPCNEWEEKKCDPEWYCPLGCENRPERPVNENQNETNTQEN